MISVFGGSPWRILVYVLFDDCAVVCGGYVPGYLFVAVFVFWTINWYARSQRRWEPTEDHPNPQSVCAVCVWCGTRRPRPVFLWMYVFVYLCCKYLVYEVFTMNEWCIIRCKHRNVIGCDVCFANDRAKLYIWNEEALTKPLWGFVLFRVWLRICVLSYESNLLLLVVEKLFYLTHWKKQDRTSSWAKRGRPGLTGREIVSERLVGIVTVEIIYWSFFCFFLWM